MTNQGKSKLYREAVTMANIRIKKVKIAEKVNKIIMTYERYVNDQYDEYTFNSSEMAAPEFYDSFKNLSEHATALCEFPAGFKDRVNVYGISFSYSGESDVMGATMSMKVNLEYSNTDLIINTPHKKSAPDGEEEFNETMYLSEQCVKALWAVEQEARKYIDGKRAQASLFNPDTAA